MLTLVSNTATVPAPATAGHDAGDSPLFDA